MRRPMLILRLIVFACAVGFGFWRAYERHNNERNILDPNGTYRLAGPLSPNGPTYGSSGSADMEITDFGWNHYTSPQSPQKYIRPFAAVRNKSGRVWRNVAVRINLIGRDQSAYPASIPIGTLRPGENRRGEGMDVPESVASSSVIGVTGQ